MSESRSPLAERALELVRASGPLAERAGKLALFGRFIGSWDMEVAFFDATGKETYRQPGEWAFSWVLDGRVIQDVLVYPHPDGLSSAVGERRIGTTLRFYDPARDAWRVVWLGATAGYLVTLTGRARGDEIHIEGNDPDGKPVRWMFTGIGEDHFTWRGFLSDDGGASWRLTQEMTARRRVER